MRILFSVAQVYAHLRVATTNCCSTTSHLARSPHRMLLRGSLVLKIPAQACGKDRLRCFASSALSAARLKGSHYDALMLPNNATKQQIKAKFYEVSMCEGLRSTIEALANCELQLSKKYHPDKTGGDISKFHEINDAYATLGDESKR